MKTIDFNYIIGKSLDEAERLVFNDGEYHIRVMMENGEKYYGSADFDLKRINVAITGTTITKILSIG
jgi:hypothetical protein